MSTYENRRFSRVSAARRVTVTAAEGGSIEGEIQNLSVRGVCVLSESQLPMGSVCTINFQSEEGREIEAKGVVVRVQDKTLAIEITAVKESTLPSLRDFVLANADDPGVLDTEIADHLDLAPDTY